MSASKLEQIAERPDARDREYVSGLESEQRDIVFSTMGRYMRYGGVAVGDPVERIYVVGGDGRIAFQGGPGSWEFDPDAAGRALGELVRAED